jgi:hypothetical protein
MRLSALASTETARDVANIKDAAASFEKCALYSLGQYRRGRRHPRGENQIAQDTGPPPRPGHRRLREAAFAYLVQCNAARYSTRVVERLDKSWAIQETLEDYHHLTACWLPPTTSEADSIAL